MPNTPDPATPVQGKGPSDDATQLDLARQVGGVDPARTDDPLVVLLYLLLRDHLQAGIFEKLVAELVGEDGASLTNPFLAGYAENIAARLRLMAPPDRFTLTTTEREGLSDCISLAARHASYEVYGGIEVQPAIQAAEHALQRMDEELPLPQDDPDQVRLQLADMLAKGRAELLKKVAIETREPAREVLMEADRLFESIFEAFAPERWKQELDEYEAEQGR